MNIPDFLFRGDADKNNVRLLRASIDHGQLQTNLISGGFGRQIFEQPLVDFINKHVGIGWDKTHFLSFSESKSTALRYGFGSDSDRFIDLEKRVIEDEETWDCVQLTVDTAQLDVSMKEVGIYHARFRPTLRKFLNQDFIEILLVNVFEALSGHPRSEHFKLSVENAKRDLEWLLLPQTPIIFDNGLVEYSAILDGGCLSEVRKYRLL